MADISRHDVGVDVLLTEISLDYHSVDYPADQLFPRVLFQFQPPQWVPSDWLRMKREEKT